METGWNKLRPLRTNKKEDIKLKSIKNNAGKKFNLSANNLSKNIKYFNKKDLKGY